MEFFLGAFESEWEQRRAALLHELSLVRVLQAAPRKKCGGGCANYRSQEVPQPQVVLQSRKCARDPQGHRGSSSLRLCK